MKKWPIIIEKKEKKKEIYKNKYFLAIALILFYYYGIPLIIAFLVALTDHAENLTA